MSPQRVLTVNGGSSSIKFAVFDACDPPQRLLGGSLDRIGSADSVLQVSGLDRAETASRPIPAPDFRTAVGALIRWIEERDGRDSLAAVGHRVVHGGPQYGAPERISREMLAELRRFSLFDPDHLPLEILLAESFHRRFPALPQVACFDTHFHRDMPRAARQLAIPRRYEEQGLRRYGFHGLSYEYLLGELARTAGAEAAQGRVILAHLGAGASLAALEGGKSRDTSMGFTPTAGIPMGTRSGDLDPGLAAYLARKEGMSPMAFGRMVNHESGLLGVSETTSDMKDLLALEETDVRAAEAVELFCYQAKKTIGAYAAALGGLETLVFSGGIGENCPPVRSRICQGLEFLGVKLDEKRNRTNGGLVSTAGGRVAVRVIRTDEEITLARSVVRLLGLGEAPTASAGGARPAADHLRVPGEPVPNGTQNLKRGLPP